MADRSVTLRLSADVKGLVAGLKTGKRALEDLSQGAKAFGPTASAGALKAQAAFLKTGQAAHAAAAKAGLLYDASGKLTDQFGRVVSEADATKKGLKAVSDEARFAAEHADRAAEAWQGFGKGMMVAGAGIIAGVGLAVKSYADFDKQMSSVDAATHETAGNMDLLRQAAIDAGADTAFSATEAAQGIEEMAKAGVSTKDIMGGGLTGALSLAAAGSLGVGDAAEIAASAMTQFKLSGEQLPHVADLLAAGAGKAQGSVQDMGAALNQTGLVAASTGLSIEETTGGLAAFASAGLTGSDAGTSFKSMLQRLTPQSLEAKNKMAELGISAYDAQGQFIGLSKFSENLKTSMKDLTPEARNAAMGVIFGSDAVRAANVLYENGAEGIQKWTNNVNDAGYAADTAAKMQDNLRGDLEKLGGSFDTVLIQSGSGANDVLRGLVQGLEGVVDGVGKVPGPLLAAGTGLAAVAGGALLLGGGLITVIPKIAATREALGLLPISATKANAALSTTGRVAAGAATGLAAVAAASAIAQPALDNILKPTGETGDALEAFGGQAARGAVGADTLSKSFQDLVQHKDGVNDFQAAIDGIADPGLWGNIDNILVGGIKILSLGMADVTSTSDKARERMGAFGEELASLDADKAATSFQSMAKQTDGSEKSLKNLLDFMPAYRKSLEEQAKASGLATDDQTLLNIALGKIPGSMQGAATATENYTTKAGNAAPLTEEMAKQLEEVGLNAQGAVTDIDAFAKSLFNAGLLSLSSSDAAIGYQDAIDKMTESVKTNGATLDLNTEAGRANQSAFNGIAKAAMTSAEASATETLATEGSAAAQSQLQGALRTSYDDLVTAAGQLGKTGDEADTMARKALGIPKNVNIDAWIADHASSTLDGIKGKADGLDGKSVDIYVNTHETTYQKTLKDPTGMGSSIGGRQNGSLAGGFAAGGPIFGPGTGTSDEIPAWLSNGEHVWTAEEVRAAGGHGAVESLRSMAKRGLPAFATGGRVGWSDRSDDQAARVAAAATNKREALASARWHAQQAYDRIGSSAKNKARKTAAQRSLNAAEKRLKSAEAAEDRAKEKLRDAKERTARLSESTRDLRTDIRRGDIADSVMSGSGLSVVDRLRDESRNKDLSTRQRGRLSRTADSSEKQLLSLEKRSDSLASKLEKAKSKFDDLMSIKSGVASGLKSEQSLSGLLGLMDDKAAAKAEANFKKVADSAQSNLDKVSGKLDAARTRLDGLRAARDGVRDGLRGEQSLGAGLGQKNGFGYDVPVSSKSLVSGARSKLAAIKAFAGKLEKLRAMGLSRRILEEVAGLGSEDGAQVADALIKGGKADVKSLNDAYAGMSSWGQKAGSVISDSMFKGGVGAAKSLVDGFESQQGAATKALNALTTPDASGKVTAKGMVKNAKSTADRIKKFAGKLDKLQKRGLSGPILEEIAGMGTEEGMRAADALLAGSNKSIKELNTQYRRIDWYSQKAGLQVTEGFYKGGVNAAKGLVKGLEDQQDAIEKQMLKIANGMQTALKKALGIHSPSKVMQKLMHHVGDGAVLGLEDSRPDVESAMTAMVTAPQASFGSWSGMVGSGSHMSAPVMELSAADRALMSQFITASQSMPPMNLMVNGRQAGAIVQEGTKAVRTLK
jgi:TP901 family phage tail tape measure protein